MGVWGASLLRTDGSRRISPDGRLRFETPMALNRGRRQAGPAGYLDIWESSDACMFAPPHPTPTTAHPTHPPLEAMDHVDQVLRAASKWRTPRQQGASVAYRRAGHPRRDLLYVTREADPPRVVGGSLRSSGRDDLYAFGPISPFCISGDRPGREAGPNAYSRPALL